MSLKKMFMERIKKYGFKYQTALAKAVASNTEYYKEREDSVRILLNQAIRGEKPFPKELQDSILNLTDNDEELMKYMKDSNEKRKTKRKDTSERKISYHLDNLFDEYSVSLKEYFQKSKESEKIQIIQGIDNMLKGKGLESKLH